MVGRAILSRAESGFTLPAFERLAPPPPPELVAARIEAGSGAGDIVADLQGRGGWIARAAIDRQRRAVTLESNPLTRLLAEVVLRPPDLRHLDAAFSTLSASPRGESSLKLSIGAMFATHCTTCGRTLVADELQWAGGGAGGGGGGAAGAAAGPRLVRKQYRCTICRDQQGGPEQRSGPPDDADLARAIADIGAELVRARLRERFPTPDGGGDLVDAILGLHTDRQLVGLWAILERIEGELRAAPVESALRLAFLHAVLPASRLSAGPGRTPSLRIAGGTVRSAIPDPFRERNPWLTFEEAIRVVRAFVQRLESGALGPLEARIASDLRGLVEGAGTAVLRVAAAGALERLAAEARDPLREPGREAPRPRIRLVLGQPPLRFSQERLAAAWHGTCWALGREAASLLPLEPLLGAAIRAPWSWQAAAIRRSLAAAAPLMARDGRAVLLLEAGEPEALVAAVLGGVGAGYRLTEARVAEVDEDVGGVVELVLPGASVPPGPRTRGNRRLDPVPGGSGDPDLVPGPGLFAPPERVDARPFSRVEAARSITETAVEVLRERGEPARYERLLGEILVGLDRAGHLRRLMALDDAVEPDAGPDASPDAGSGNRDRVGDEREPDEDRGGQRPDASAGGGRTSEAPGPGGFGRSWSRGIGSHPPATVSAAARLEPADRDPVERVLALVRDELARPSQHRLVEIEPGRWWLGEREDREAAAVPLADRVEWAVYSLLSTAGPLPEGAFFERVAALFSGHDLPDEALVRACLASYRSPASTAERLVTGEDVRRRTADHTELLALLANGGHRLGMSVWLGRREQGRRIGDRTLGDFLDERERSAWLASVSRAPTEDLEAVDCIWYVRGRSALLFEVEWTAMLGDVLLRRHARIPADEHLVRVLAIAPERAELVRHKLDASPLLRAAIEEANWHLVLWPYLRAWLEREPLELDGLEPFLGLEPAVERRGEQLGMFEGPDALR
ncbi:MAG: hypothetical protein L0227_01070 [Chloroflexi bacterium]|nr:hypothetical protein [Chloroflexota bacterium]